MSLKLRGAARLGLAVTVVAGFCATTATAAHAAPPVATLTMSGEMHYEAALNQVNYLRISIASPGVYSFSDNVPITYATPDGSTCWYPYAVTTTVYCNHSASFLDIKTYDLDDTIDNRSPSNVHADAGEGNDTIRMGGHVTAAAAGDAAGGGGNDVIISGPGDDWISGGTGTDTVSYQGRTAAVTASLATGGGGDPAAGEADVFVSGIENLTGGGAADTLTGNDAANVLDGGWYTTPCSPFPTGTSVTTVAMAPPPCTTYSGDDTIDGKGGPDTLRGRQGADVLLGGLGNDVIHGDAGYDGINGGPDSDVCYPGADGAFAVSCTIL